MIYHLTLKAVGIAVGLLLIITHAFAYLQQSRSIAWARAFPRARVESGILLAAAAVWSFALVRQIDLGEFSNLRSLMLLAIVAGAILSWFYVEEFLAVRALGMLLLLAAEPLLEAAVLRNEPTRLLLVVLAYAWIIAGLFFVGMPYLLRDAVGWVTARPWRWEAGCIAGTLYGLAILLCAILLW